MSQLLEGNDAYGGYSDSEAEDDETTKVELAERYVGSGNGASQQSAMKLVELGPRMGLELFKVERGMCEGDVLYHKFETKTPAEVRICFFWTSCCLRFSTPHISHSRTHSLTHSDFVNHFNESLYHQAAALKNKADSARQLKEERRRVQEENVKRKRAEAEAQEAANAAAGVVTKKPRRGLESWAKNKKETFVGSDSDEEGEQEQEEGEGEEYYSDSDADA